ncbi:O-methyltransferase [Gracilimonas sp.]|uniref:O-methyltransferase n=1 Tax=Gracilimonas sp. TaxID=1974203 RepID=UPI003BAB2068
MKKHRDTSIVQITDANIEEYAREMTTPESEGVKALIASSDAELEYIDMLSGNLVGQMLKMLIKISGAKRILEIGTFTGYSAIMMAEALPDEGEIITLEMNLRYQKLACKHFREFDHQNKIKLLEGNARELIPELKGEFDFIFIDADKLSYESYFKQALPLLKQGGLMVVDNVLWDGTVLDPEDQKAQALHEFNKMVSQDSRVEQVLLPVRDGVTIIRKK